LNPLPERSMKALFMQRSETTRDNAPMVFLSHPLPQGLRRLGPTVAAGVWCLCVVTGSAVHASDGDDHDRARQAVQAGLVLPLPTVLDRLQREVPGQVLEVELELEQDHGLWVYEIKLLTPAGQLTKVKLDAQTARVLRIQSREGRSQRRDAHSYR